MPEERETICDPPRLPLSLGAATAGYRWRRDCVGESGGTVYRLIGEAGRPDLFLKHGEGRIAQDVTDEMARLRWLAGRAPVPEVVQFFAAPSEAWLLTTAVPGETAWQLLERCAAGGGGACDAVVDALADVLVRLHALAPDECPFNSDHRLRLAHARQRLDAGLVDCEDFDDERRGWSAQQVWDALQRLLPLPFDPVVTHGDFSLDNILIEGGTVAGIIDVGRAGIADRYQDIAIMWNSLAEFGPDLQARFLRRYGIAIPDEARLRFHLLLDELF